MTADIPNDDREVSDARPLLFISHRHLDKQIADSIRTFVTARSGGRVRVFQSSDASAEGPRIGRSLNQELTRNLWEASMVILVYTSEDQDWSYCMWECGVATHPQSPDTRIVLFQCGSRFPGVFADQVRVNIQQAADVQRFTNDFLTSPDFFPRYGQPLAPGFHPNDQNVEQAAQAFYDELRRTAPVEGEIDEWPPYPFVRLELTSDQVDRVCEEPPDGRLKLTSEILQDALVTDGDAYAAKLFGMPSIPSAAVFGVLVSAWKERFPDTPPNWVEGLAGQIMEAAQWRFPTLRWELMRSCDTQDGTWYGPAVNVVRRMPSRALQVDIYFDKFAVDDGGAVEIGLPTR
jgi:hypothetical protein